MNIEVDFEMKLYLQEIAKKERLAEEKMSKNKEKEEIEA